MKCPNVYLRGHVANLALTVSNVRYHTLGYDSLASVLVEREALLSILPSAFQRLNTRQIVAFITNRSYYHALRLEVCY